MRLGSSLFQARKKSGFTQEDVAEKLGVSRQTISKWESDETVPDIRQSKKLAVLYHMTLDELITFDFDADKIQEMINHTDEKVEEKINWTSAWGKKYPVLLEYQEKVCSTDFAHRLGSMLDEIKQSCHYSEQDAFLVLKDILYQVWKQRKQK